MEAQVGGYVREVVAALERATEASHVVALLRHAAAALLPRDACAAADAPTLAALCAGVALEAAAPRVAAAGASLRAACGGSSAAGCAAARRALYEGGAFSLLADALLCVVAPDWLPCLPACAAPALLDAFFAAAPAAAALDALAARASAPRREAEDAPRGGAAAAANPGDDAPRRTAQRLLVALFVAPGATGVASLAAEGGCGAGGAPHASAAAAAQARDAAASALAALPDVCACARAPPPPLLQHAHFAAAVTAAALAAAASDRSAASAVPFAAAALAKLTRRGAAADVARVVLRHVRDAERTADAAASAESSLAAATCAVVATLPDVAALSRLVEALLRASAGAEGAAGGPATERALRRLLAAPLWASPPVRLLLTHTLLLRRTLPRAALRALLRLVILDPPAPPPSDIISTPDNDDAVLALRREALGGLAAAWGAPEFASGAAGPLQAYCTGALCACLRALPPGALQQGLPGLTPALLAGVSARLGAGETTVRLSGMRVAAALSRAFAAAAKPTGAQPPTLLFPEAEAAPPEPGDEWGGDLWADEAHDVAAGGTPDAEAAASPPAGTATPPLASSDHQAAASEEEEEDPDAMFVPMGGGATQRGPPSEASYDSDDASSAGDGGALSPYELSDVEEGGGGDGAGAGAAPAAAAAAPTSLRGLLDGLRGGENDGDAVEAALLAAEPLLRAAPSELPAAAPALALALLSARPPAPDEARLAAVRAASLLALLATAPAAAAPTLGAQLPSEQLDTSQRLEILDAFTAAAEELSSIRPPDAPALPAGAMRAATPAGAAADNAGGGAARRRGRTRLIAPVSLARRQRGGGPAAAPNRFAPVAAAFLAPLLALCGGRGPRADAAERDALVHGRALVAAGACIACAARSPAAASLAPALLALLARAPASGASAAAPYVRRAAHYAAAAALQSLPPGTAAAAVSEDRSPLIADIDAVCALAAAAREGDPDGECRALGGAVLASRAALGEAAAAAAAAAGPADTLRAIRLPSLGLRFAP